jgi:acetyl-CoA C-acetyltransferase
VTRATPLGQILGVAQLPMRTRQPRFTYADLLGRVAHEALADAQLEAKDIDGLMIALSPTTLLGIDEPYYWGLAGLPGADRFIGRVQVAAASGIPSLRLACAYIAARRAKRILIVSADLADESPSLGGAIGQLQDPFTDRQFPRNAIVAAAVQMSGYMAAHGLDERDMAHVIVKNRANGAANIYAQLRQAVTLDEVLASPPMAWPIKRLDSSPRTSGAAAIVVGPPDQETHRRPVCATGFGSFVSGRNIGARMVPGDSSYFDGSDLAVAGRKAYAMANVTDPATQIDLAEVYASFGVIELISIEALGLAGGSNAARRLGEGAFMRDAALPVNPSGGATCGNPISSAGLIRIIEAVHQLRGDGGERQVKRPVDRAVVSAIGGTFQSHEVTVLQA